LRLAAHGEQGRDVMRAEHVTSPVVVGACDYDA
jgi:hypothetical protein